MQRRRCLMCCILGPSFLQYVCKLFECFFWAVRQRREYAPPKAHRRCIRGRIPRKGFTDYGPLACILYELGRQVSLKLRLGERCPHRR